MRVSLRRDFHAAKCSNSSAEASRYPQRQGAQASAVLKVSDGFPVNDAG